MKGPNPPVFVPLPDWLSQLCFQNPVISSFLPLTGCLLPDWELLRCRYIDVSIDPYRVYAQVLAPGAAGGSE